MNLRLLCLLLVMSGCVRRVAIDSIGGDEAPQDPPQGMMSFSAYAEPEGQRWSVFVGDKEVCTTPCSEFVKPSDFISLERRGIRLDVFDLATAAGGARNAIIVAEGENEALKVNGITFTTLGGMGIVVSTVLSAVGCGDFAERSGMCIAGLIVGGVSVPLTVAAIAMLVGSAPTVHVLPVPGKNNPPVTLRVTPVGVVGTF